jgi:hypothetical protein
VVYFGSWISLLIFCSDDLSIDDNGLLKSPTNTVLELIYAFMSFVVCLMKLGVLTLGTYIVHKYIYVCPSPSNDGYIFFHILAMINNAEKTMGLQISL